MEDTQKEGGQFGRLPVKFWDELATPEVSIPISPVDTSLPDASSRMWDKRVYPGWGPIGGGARGCTRCGDQSEEGREGIPRAGTNRRRDEK
eukprot:187714-Prorocentrum_minimum.AAC.1